MVVWLHALLLAAQSAPAPVGRYSHCAVVYGNHMIVYGGRGFQQQRTQVLTTLGDVWALNLFEMSWSLLVGAGDSSSSPPDLGHPGQRSSHACVMLRDSEDGGEMLVFGGLSGGGDADQNMQNDAWKLILKGRGWEHGLSAEWERVAMRGTAPRPRSDHSAIVVDDGVLVYGGCIGSSAFGDLWLLHETGAGTAEAPFSYEWLALDAPPSSLPPDALPAPPSPPNASSATPPAPPPSGGNYAAADQAAGDESTQLPPDARCAHTAAALEGGMLVFGGRAPLPHTSRDESWQARGNRAV